MKILHISKYYYPQVGGIETVVRNLAEGAAKRGHDVTVLCVSGDRQSHTEYIAGVRVERVPCYGILFSQPIAPGILTRVKSLSQNADLIHIHSPHPLAELNVFRDFGSTPVVISHHGDVTRQKFLLPFYNFLMKRVYSKVKNIICSSGKVIWNNSILNQFSGKSLVVPYGIDLSRFDQVSEENERVQRLKSEFGNFSLFVGRLVSYKGVDTLVSAMKHTSGKVLIIGEGPMEAALRKQVVELELNQQVIFLGKVSNTDLLFYYKACDYLILPSVTKAESFGVVMVEAMACGKPVISTSLDSGVVDVNLDRETGFVVPPSDPESLASAMNRLSENAGVRKEFGANALQHSRTVFALDRMIENYLSIYEKILNQKPKKQIAA